MYQSFVGLEIHIQLLTQTKVFCNCRASFGDEPNTNVCPICMGYPGVLPTLNEQAIELSYTVARALNCELNPECVFDRKNYFYPDLPKNYQISQFYEPLGRNGFIDLEFHKKKKRVRIHEIHLEEDAGKMIHAGDMSLLDYNRTGTPLLEIVTEPDLEIGEEAEVLLQELRRMVRYLGVCDGNMEQGSMRCDANISINRRGAGLGNKVEIKNLNSSRFVRKALNYEIERQQDIVERGGTIKQETRLWNENRDLTESMRSKESAHDYRYFPEPDLPHFRTSPEFLARVEARLVELPAERRERFGREYGLAGAQAEFLCDEKSTADYFESAVAGGAPPDALATWLAGDVRKQLNRHSMELVESPLTPSRLAELLRLLGDGTIHGKIAKQVLARVFEEDKDPTAVIEEQGWKQINDPAELAPFVDQVLADNPKAVEQVAEGDSRPIGFLVGQIMKATQGRAEPSTVQGLLSSRLSVKTIEVFSFGGAIAGSRQPDGLIVPGDLLPLGELAAKDPHLPDGLRFEEITLGSFLSEEITPSDWANLIARTHSSLEHRTSQGVVIGHGTDTLSYTASLLYWFFADAAVPLVLTASASPRSSSNNDAVDSLRAATRTAASAEPGLHVVYGDNDFHALNLRFERVSDPVQFRTWNPDGLPRNATPLAATARTLGTEQLTAALERAIAQTHIMKVYPGMRGESLIALMDAGVRYFVLELFDTGTASLRESPFSLRKAFTHGRERGVSFYCTSQQEGLVDFSDYVTAHALWREGAIPMGGLTTESAWTRLIAAQAEAFANAPESSDPAGIAGQVASLMED